MKRLLPIIITACALISCNNNTEIKSVIADSDFRQAVRDGNVTLVTSYLDDGYDINRSGTGGENALQEGILHYDIARLLIDRGIKVNQKNKYDGTTPLFVATIAGNVEARTVKLLLDEGADPTITDIQGKTALDHAMQYAAGHPESYQPKIDLLKEAINNR